MSIRAVALTLTSFAIALSTTAGAGGSTLATAITRYNDLPLKARVLTLETGNAAPGSSATRVPAWLTQLQLTDREATATVAAFGVYGNDYQVNYQSRNWSRRAVAAGWIADTIATNTGRGSGPYPDAQPNLAPSRELTELRRAKLLSSLRELGTCTGALATVVRKAAAVNASDDATRLLVKAQRDLGANALPPDDSCLS
jgi:hypothetical protein